MESVAIQLPTFANTGRVPVPRLRRRRQLAWQGWTLTIPTDWDPVRIEGDFDRGSVFLADLHRPKIGLRWQTVLTARSNADDLVARAMRDEVGSDGTALPHSSIWTSARLALSSELPGRDVFIAYCQKRLVQLSYHTTRRDRVFEDVLLPTFADAARGDWQAWNIFDLSCEVPSRFGLKTHSLLSGELRLDFVAPRERVVVRQIAIASLALQNRSIESWIVAQQLQNRTHYRAASEGAMKRRRRFVLVRSLPAKLFTVALRDERADRLLIVEASDEALTRQTLATMTGAEDA